MRRKYLLFVFCAAVCPAQTPDLSPDLILLSKIKTQMAATLRKQPDYTCVQQIERSRRVIPRQRFELVDMLRLEVALVDGHELFAWPGSKKFEDKELRHMVSGGAIGNGNFALHARAVFMGSGPVFTARGQEKVDGRGALRFDFKVSLLNSGYTIRVGDREAVVAYHGSFWADPGNGDLFVYRSTPRICPTHLGLSVASDRMDYSRIRIGASDFLLPSASELTMIDLNGNESRNRTRFTSCRQYTGESVLSFADPAPETAAAAPVDEPPQELRGGLYPDIRLDTDIDSEKAAVGDRVEATLDQPLRYKHKLLMPRGATLSGRIVRMDHRHGDHMLELKFTEANAEHSHWNLIARVSEIRTPGFALTPERFEKSLSAKMGLQLGTIYMRGNRIHLPRGVRMTLRTENMGEGGSAPAQENQ